MRFTLTMHQNPAFDLVVSGINRGDNCGLHVIYSGTVGAAREAACKVRAPLLPLQLLEWRCPALPPPTPNLPSCCTDAAHTRR